MATQIFAKETLENLVDLESALANLETDAALKDSYKLACFNHRIKTMREIAAQRRTEKKEKAAATTTPKKK